MFYFDNNLIEEYAKWKQANDNNFSWWSYVNMKSDLQTALAFTRFFTPKLIQVDECLILEDRFSTDLFEQWKCQCDKTGIEKAMNSYELKDFFHINTKWDDNWQEQLLVLGEALKYFWSMSFRQQHPQKTIVVDTFEEDDSNYITVYEQYQSKSTD